MKARDFCYWLQGFFEIGGTEPLNEEQVKMIRDHLNLVFLHEIDPSFPKQEQSALNAIHEGKPVPGFPKDVKMRC